MKRRREIFLPPVALDRASSVPLHTQLRTQFAAAIRRGAAGGLRLPSTRTVARMLGLSRNTVLAAYDDLASDGLIRGQQGSGMLVSTEGTRNLPGFDLPLVLREAQYPARRIDFNDPDGASLYLNY